MTYECGKCCKQFSADGSPSLCPFCGEKEVVVCRTDSFTAKTIRTLLYEDFTTDEWELELLHTPIMQRLYNLKQLGYTDRVFPDAIHSRFNHTLGTIDRVSRIMRSVEASLREGTGNLISYQCETQRLSTEDLLAHVKMRYRVSRLMALLHDVPHIPFGHTLEDELHIFNTEHDAPTRQRMYFDILTEQLAVAQIIRHDPEGLPKVKERLDLRGRTKVTNRQDLLQAFEGALKGVRSCHGDGFYEGYISRMIDTLRAMVTLQYLSVLKMQKEEPKEFREACKDIEANSRHLLITDAIRCLLGKRDFFIDFHLAKESYLIDAIGNTICADLLDYCRRDFVMAGLHNTYDDRIFKYFTLTSFRDGVEAPPSIRLCLQVFTHKLRFDVVSEILTVLRNRYLLSERLLFHPTKCVAGGMLGKVVYLTGLQNPGVEDYRIGDEGFLSLLEVRVTRLLEWAVSAERGLQRKGNGITGAAEINKVVQDCLDTVWKDLSPRSELPWPTDELRLAADAIVSHLPGGLVRKNNREKMALSRAVLSELLTRSEGLSEGGEETLDLFSSEGGQVSPMLRVVSWLKQRFEAARAMLWQLQARQYYKRAYQLASIGQVEGETDLEFVAEYLKDPTARFLVEREIEKGCELPYGSIVVYCPKRSTTLKEAEVLITRSDQSDEPVRFCAIPRHHRLASLTPYMEEEKALSTMYSKIWSLFVFGRVSCMNIWPLIEEVAGRIVARIISLNPDGTTFDKVESNRELRGELRRAYGRLAFPLAEAFEMIDSRQLRITKDIVLVRFLREKVGGGGDAPSRTGGKANESLVRGLLEEYLGREPK